MNKTVFFLALLFVGSLAQYYTPDRLKRCDWDQNPPCKPCEGVGGIITGDDISQIQFASCQVIADAATMNKSGVALPPPLYPKSFTNHISGVLVSPFAEPNPHTYFPQESTWYFDTNSNALSFVNNLLVPISLPFVSQVFHVNFSGVAMHKGNEMYITPAVGVGPFKLPLCICQDLQLGPLMYNAFEDALYLGREMLSIEYLWNNFTVDHYVKGPHHLWVDVSTGLPIRAWQPFNGLQVYSQWQFSLPDTHVFDIPTICNPGKGINFGCPKPTTTRQPLSPLDYMSAFAETLQHAKQH